MADGLYLPCPYADQIVSGKKTLIARSEPGLTGEFLLVTGGSSDGKALGKIVVEEGQAVTANEFDARYDEHRVSAYKRKAWWGDRDKLYLHEVAFEGFKAPVPVDVDPGVQTLMGTVNLEGGLGDGPQQEKKMPSPRKDESRDDFVSRCIPIVLKEGTAKDQKQAAAICFSMWREDKKDTDKKTKLKAALESLWKLIVGEGEKEHAVKVVGDYLLLWPTNAFQDRELEIFTTQSIEDYVERHKGDSVKGRAMYRHWKGTDFGDIVYQAMSGRFLVEVARFDDSPLGQAFKQLFTQYPDGHPDVSPEGWGYSHGYKYNPVDRLDKTYEWFDKDESSVLPASVASNPHNPTSVEVIQMNDKEYKELETLIGPELAAGVAKKGESLTEEKEQAGVAFKGLTPPNTPKEEETPIEEKVEEKVETPETPKAPAETPAEEKAPETPAESEVVEQVVEAVTKAFDMKALSGVIETQATAIKTLAEEVKALKSLESRLAEVERSDEERLAEKTKEQPRFFWQAVRPSQAEDNKIKDGDPIRSKVPVEAPSTVVGLAEKLQ